MSTEATTQVLDTSVDAEGVSVISATRTVVAPRQGAMYNPVTLAAAVPLWFHRVQDGRYLAVLKSRWTAATQVYNNGPQLYSAYTETTIPAWTYVVPVTGNISTVLPIPSLRTGARVITAAVSRRDYLFILGTLDGEPFLQCFRTVPQGAMVLVGEETLLPGLTRGLYADRTHLHVYGADEGGYLVVSRKNWGRIGINTDTARQWEYRGPRGWYADPSETVALPTTVSGGRIKADGPVSVASFRDRLYLATVFNSSGTRQVLVYTARAVDDWKFIQSFGTALGDNDTYLGAGMQLQPQLVANRALMSDGVVTAFPYLTSKKVISGGNSGILTTWGLLEV